MGHLNMKIRVIIKAGIDPYVLRDIELYAAILLKAGHTIYCNESLNLKGVKPVIATDYHLILVGSAIHAPRGTNCRVVNCSRIGFERELTMFMI